jgi:predicted nuclease of restriction endonuclease-like (RecB) superfamily
MSQPNKAPPGLPVGYPELLADLKGRIRAAQVRAALSVNRELVLLYWQMGRSILQRQGKEGWGAKVIDRLSVDLRREFPEMKGFSPRNLKYMRAFAEAYSDETFVQEVLAQITWYHNITLLSKVGDPVEREWYLCETVKNGWSRNVLVHQIESDLFRRQGKAVTNLHRTLPSPQSDLAQEILKDPYNFDFLSLGERASERDLHRSLLAHLRDFLIELGVGFAFVGSEHPLEVGGQDFWIDLLFYHLRLRCYVVIELKIGDFAPEQVGKLNFYLSAVDDLIRDADHDGPTIGLLLCKTKNRVIAEYALRDLKKPMGVSSYRLKKALAGEMKRNLPTVEELEAELGGSKEEP